MSIRIAALCTLLLSSAAAAEASDVQSLEALAQSRDFTQVYVAPIQLPRDGAWQAEGTRQPTERELATMHRALKAGVGKNLDVIANPSPGAITLRPTLIAAQDVAPGVAIPEDRQIAVKFAIEEDGVVIGEFVDHKSAEAVVRPERETHTRIAQRVSPSSASGGSTGPSADEARAMAASTRSETIRPRYAFATDAFRSWGEVVGAALAR